MYRYSAGAYGHDPGSNWTPWGRHCFDLWPARYLNIFYLFNRLSLFRLNNSLNVVSQIFVEEFTVQFLNLPGCEFCIRLAMGAEYIGICNFSWLLYGTMSRLCCINVNKARKTMNSTNATSDEMIMSPTTKNRGLDFETGLEFTEPLTWFDYIKYLWSTVATCGSVFIVCYGIAKDTFVLPVPVAGAFIIAIITLVVLFYLEGLMIAIVTTQFWDPETFREG